MKYQTKERLSWAAMWLVIAAILIACGFAARRGWIERSRCEDRGGIFVPDRAGCSNSCAVPLFDDTVEVTR